MATAFVCLVGMLLAADTVGAMHDWPAWRGPTADGLSRESDVPLTWSSEQNVAWKVRVPGRGHSSPVVWGDWIFTASSLEEQNHRVLLCFDRRTGDLLWQRVVLASPLEDIHRLNSRASSTPATDGKHVFISFLDRDQMLVACLDVAGNTAWQRRPGPFESKHGFCTNPVLYKDSVIVNGDHDGDAYLAMLKKDTGDVVWRTPRENRTRSYSTPVIVPVSGRDQLVITGSKCTAGYDVQTGAKLWTVDGPSEQMVATVLHGHGLIFALGGFPERHLLAIEMGGAGDVTNTHVRWRTNQSMPYVPSALLYGDLLHVISDEGVYTCFEAKTGAVRTRQRAVKHTSASLVGANDRVYILDDTGTMTVIANEPGFRVLARNSLGEETYASPALARGNIFLRGLDHLYRIGPAEDRRLQSRKPAARSSWSPQAAWASTSRGSAAER